MNKDLKEKLEKLCLLYQDYLAECDVYDGADFWGSDKVKKVEEEFYSLLYSHLLKKLPKEKYVPSAHWVGSWYECDYCHEDTSEDGHKCKGSKNNDFNHAISEIKQILKKELRGK